MLFVLLFCFSLSNGNHPVPAAGSNPLWNELRQNANRAESRGDFAAAERYYLQAIQVAEEAGFQSGQFAAAEELGQLYWKEYNAPAAVTYTRMAVAILRRYFPADSNLKGSTLNSLASMLRGAGCFNEAEQTALEALRVFQNIESVANVAATYNGLAEVEIGRRRYSLAETYLKQSLGILERHRLENVTTARALETLARIYARVGRTREADDLIPRAEAICRRNLPSPNADLMQCLDTKATLLFGHQRYSEAERLWNSIIESAKAARPPIVIGGASYHLAELYTVTKQYDKAQELLEQLLRSKAYSNPSDRDRALIEGQLAYVLMRRREDERADALFQSAVSTLAASSLNASLEYALICQRYGELKARHKDWSNAAVYLERGIKIDSELIPESSMLAEALELGAQVFRKLGRNNDAKSSLNRAKIIRAVLDKARPSDTVDVQRLAADRR